MSSSPSEDAHLARVLECPRDAYIEGDAKLRAAFAAPTIRHFTESELVYKDGTLKYNAGELQPGDPAPDVAVSSLAQTHGLLSLSMLGHHRTGDALTRPQRQHAEGNRFLILDFGSYS